MAYISEVGTEVLSEAPPPVIVPNDLHGSIRDVVKAQLAHLSTDLQRAVREEVERSMNACWSRRDSWPLESLDSGLMSETTAGFSDASRPSRREKKRKPTLLMKRFEDPELRHFISEEEHALGVRHFAEPGEDAEAAEAWGNASLRATAAVPPRPPSQGLHVLHQPPDAGDSDDGLEKISVVSETLPSSVPERTVAVDEPVDQSQANKRMAKKGSTKKSFADDALGLNRGDSKRAMDRVNDTYLQKLAERIVRDERFEIVSTVLIVSSAVHVGLQTDVMARGLLTEVPKAYRTVDVIFCLIFTLELCLRLFAYREKFFKVWGWGWNLFDLLLIGSQLIEEMLLLLAASTMRSFASGDLLRVVRVLRTIRTIRVLHIMRFANDLQMLVSCLLRSSKAFIWSLGLIVLMLYVVAVYFTQLSTLSRIEAVDDLLGLKKWYGSVPLAVLSLFQGLTGGVDWNDLVRPMMEHISPWMGVWFFVYIAFALLLVMNVVAATFVESAIDRASKVREMQKLSQALRLFKSLDKDCSGYISFTELEDHMQTYEVQEFFESIDVDASEAKCLFDLIDRDGNGSIEFNEFLSGCLRLNAPAKSMDIIVAMHHMNRSLDRMQSAMRHAATKHKGPPGPPGLRRSKAFGKEGQERPSQVRAFEDCD